MNILVAEDDKVNCCVISLYLNKYQHKIVHNGLEAIESLKTEYFDVIFMDLMMPVMSGLHATKEIRTNPEYDDIVIIALTAFGTEDMKKQCLDAGMNYFLTKPVDKEQLLDLLSNIEKLLCASTSSS